MTNHSAKLGNMLQAHGYSMTRPRLIVFQALENNEQLTMHELYDKVAGSIDRASLYRTIDVFEKLGIVRRVNIGWKYKLELSDAFTEHHHHLTCTQCGTVIAISEQDLEGFITAIADRHEFTISEHQIEIQGMCKACRYL